MQKHGPVWGKEKAKSMFGLKGLPATPEEFFSFPREDREAWAARVAQLDIFGADNPYSVHELDEVRAGHETKNGDTLYKKCNPECSFSHLTIAEAPLLLLARGTHYLEWLSRLAGRVSYEIPEVEIGDGEVLGCMFARVAMELGDVARKFREYSTAESAGGAAYTAEELDDLERETLDVVRAALGFLAGAKRRGGDN